MVAFPQCIVAVLASRKRMCILDSSSRRCNICEQTTKRVTEAQSSFVFVSGRWKNTNLLKMLKRNPLIEIIGTLQGLETPSDVVGTDRICFSGSTSVSSVTIWGTFVLATSNMAASAIALAASCPMVPLFDRSSSTTLAQDRKSTDFEPSKEIIRG